ncbi:MAG: hypothetical protein M3Y45_01340 [Actinomycetota bacterium]|nr:hypothetical protein [Actinomycetota bacterium]
MADRAWSKEELEAAVERLNDPDLFRQAEMVVAEAAPGLQGVLVSALGSGGWFGESHLSETLKAATIPDEDQRLTAIRSLLTEETHMGMMVGVAVGWALHRELEGEPTGPDDDQYESETGGTAAGPEEN